MTGTQEPIQVTSANTGGGRRRWIERATLYGLAGSALIHLLIVAIAALVTVKFSFGDAGGNESEGVEFAVLSDADLASDSSVLLETQRTPIDTMLTESQVELEMLSEIGQDQSVEDLSESIAPALDPGGGGLTSIDTSTGSSGAGSGDGASFFGLEAKGTRFAYIVDISGSMRTTSGAMQSRWDLTRQELIRSIRSLETGAEFHVQLYESDSKSLYGTNAWIDATAASKRSAASGLSAVYPDGATNPEPAFRAIFRLDPEPDAIYYMTDGEVSDPGELASVIRSLNRRKRVPIHCVLFGDAGSADAQQRVESFMKNVARQSGGRFTRISEGSP